MVIVKIENDCIEIQIQGANKFWALKSRLSIQLENVQSVEVVSDLKTSDYLRWYTMKVGTFMPGYVAEGTFYRQKGRLFVNIHQGASGIVLKLKNDKYCEVVIEVENPQVIAQEIENAMDK